MNNQIIDAAIEYIESKSQLTEYEKDIIDTFKELNKNPEDRNGLMVVQPIFQIVRCCAKHTIEQKVIDENSIYISHSPPLVLLTYQNFCEFTFCIIMIYHEQFCLPKRQN